MANPKIKFKRSGVASKKPTLSNLELGEIALNTYDGKLFTVQDTGGVGIATTVTTINPWSETYGGSSIEYNNDVNIGGKTDITGGLEANSVTSREQIFVGVFSSFFDETEVYFDDTTDAYNFDQESLGITLKANGDGNFAGIVTAGSFYGNGSNLTGVVKDITAGNNIVVSNSNGNYIITSTGGAGGQNLDSVLTEGNTSTRGMSVGVVTSTRVSVSGTSEFQNDIYVNQIRRRSSDSTTTKIQLNSNQIKLFAGNGTTAKLSVNSTVAITTNTTVSGFVSATTYYGDGSNLTGISAGTGNTSHVRTDSLVVSGISTLGVVTGAIYYGDGSNLTGIAASSSTKKIQIDNFTGVTTSVTFSGGYDSDFLNVYLNGVKLISGTDYTATDGSTISLTNPGKSGDVLDSESFTTTSSRLDVSEETFTATHNQTEFTTTKTFSSNTYVQVFLNGVKLRLTTDFTKTPSHTITLVKAASTGDLVDIVIF